MEFYRKGGPFYEVSILDGAVSEEILHALNWLFLK